MEDIGDMSHFKCMVRRRLTFLDVHHRDSRFAKGISTYFSCVVHSLVRYFDRTKDLSMISCLLMPRDMLIYQLKRVRKRKRKRLMSAFEITPEVGNLRLFLT